MQTGVIFYCDDDDDDLMMFTDIMKQVAPNTQCITINDSEEALQLLSSETISPDLIFLDINMPKMSGIEILAWLKRYHALSDVPIVMYSTSLNQRETDYCTELGANRVIAKLFSFDESIRQLQEVIKSLPIRQKSE